MDTYLRFDSDLGRHVKSVVSVLGVLSAFAGVLENATPPSAAAHRPVAAGYQQDRTERRDDKAGNPHQRRNRANVTHRWPSSTPGLAR